MAGNKQYDWPQLGNETAISFLQSALTNNKVSSCYIFNGIKDLGKFQIAKSFACNLINSFDKNKDFNVEKVENSGDLQIIKVEEGKKDISIEQVRNLIKNLNLSSFLNSYKVGIIKEAHKLNLKSSNALLKTLEEPQSKVVIVLLTEKIDALPQTIVSRSQVINFYPVKKDLVYDYLLKNYQADRYEAKRLSGLSMGRPALAVKFLEDKDFYQDYVDKAEFFIEALEHDENYRFKKIKDNLAKNLFGASGRELSFDLLDVWELVARDLLLIENRQENLIVFEDFKDRLKLLDNISSLDVLNSIQRARKYLELNLNPKSVLEELFVSF